MSEGAPQSGDGSRGKGFAVAMVAIVLLGLLALGAAWWFLDGVAERNRERSRRLIALERDVERKIAAIVPAPRSAAAAADPSGPEFVVRLRRLRAGTATEVEAAGESLGELTPVTLETLERAARLRLARGPDDSTLRGVVESSPAVPTSEVIRAVDALFAAGLKDVEFVGTSEPGSTLDRIGTGGK